ncbi:glycoside hydrolase family 1 protein [Luethyella okanaganae]|uniref:Glycoside hydrolase family 1 protein n=1 Tax=Luethyella okanaganae TaxID=69372 RepID=A0ABW1VEF8_9MICO
MTKRFPTGFLWGAATAAHQIEGNNVNSDWWLREHDIDRVDRIEEPSGDAADSYHRYREDMRLLADAGLTSYRFSIEWARIEPEQGFVSRAELDHYRRMVDTARELGLEPMVTLHHFTVPRWFDAGIGWRDAASVDAFARYVEATLPVLDEVELVCTINEPNMVAVLAHASAHDEFLAGRMPPADPVVADNLVRAHEHAVDIVRGAGKSAGWSVATQAFQPEPGSEGFAREFSWSREDLFLQAAANDDWVGVQAYTRTKVGPRGPLPIAEGTELTLTGWEYYPSAIEYGIRNSWVHAPGVPVYVTENGIATADDARRIDYTLGALEAVARTMADGIDVRGYLHWSALDNYEWGSFRPTFGLIAWDRETFERHPKPSLAWLGGVARANRLPGS